MKIKALLLSTLAFSVNAELMPGSTEVFPLNDGSFTESTDVIDEQAQIEVLEPIAAQVAANPTISVYDLKFNQHNHFEAQMHDYINDVLQSCGQPVMRWSRYGAYSNVFEPTANKDQMCQSLLNEPPKVTCNSVLGNLQSGAERPDGLPDDYPVVAESDLSGKVMLAGFIGCFINDTFAQNNEVMPIAASYTFEVIQPTYGKLEIGGENYMKINNYTTLAEPVVLTPDETELPSIKATIVLAEAKKR